jgi:hypothetical protein
MQAYPHQLVNRSNDRILYRTTFQTNQINRVAAILRHKD